MNQTQKDRIKKEVIDEVGLWLKQNVRNINHIQLPNRVREKIVEVTISKTEEIIMENLAE